MGYVNRQRETICQQENGRKGKGEKCDRGKVNECGDWISHVRVRAHTTGILCFLLSQVSHVLDNSLLLCWLSLFYNVFWRFCRKRRFVLLKTTCCFVENDVLFYWKRRVVFWERTEELRNIRGKRKTEWGEKTKRAGVCDTCDSKKWEIPVMRDRAYTRMCARTSASVIFQFGVHRLDFLEGNPLVFSIYQHLYKRRCQCSSCLVEREMISENASG